MARSILLALLVLMLAACASGPKPVRETAPADGAPKAAPLPQSDLYKNRWGDDIPVVLLKAMEDAYALPYPADCHGLVEDVQALDAVLGEDIDSREGGPADENFIASVMVGAIKGLIPYRSWLSRLSGEYKRERRGLAAIAAGGIRRAYLKGLGETWGCPLPGKPKRPAVEASPGS